MTQITRIGGVDEENRKVRMFALTQALTTLPSSQCSIGSIVQTDEIIARAAKFEEYIIAGKQA